MIHIPDFPPIQTGATRLVLEAGPCENDLGYALDAAAQAASTGAWGFKVQLYQADTLVRKDAPRYDKTGGAAHTQHEAFKDALSYDQWFKVKQVCDQQGIVFFASPFDLEAVDVLNEMGVPLFKIASGDITHRPLLEKLAEIGKPVVLSTGASELPEIRDALQWMQQINPQLEVCLLVCTLSYPCNLEDAHLNRISTWREAGQEMIGYSDHTRGVDAPLIAAQLGAVTVEKHFTLKKNQGYDSDFAVDTLEAAEIVHDMGTRTFKESHPAFGLPHIGIIPAELPARNGARRSICAAQDMVAGTKLSDENIVFLRPASGLPPSAYREVVGKLLNQDVEAGQPLARGMLSGAFLSVF